MNNNIEQTEVIQVCVSKKVKEELMQEAMDLGISLSAMVKIKMSR